MKNKSDLRFDVIKNFLIYFYPVSNELVNELAQISTQKVVKSHEIILKNGEKCSKVFLIVTGILRCYIINQRKEITTWISCDNELATSIASFFTDKKSNENIQTLEKSTLIIFEKNKLENIFKKHPEFNEVVRKILQLYYAQAEERAYITRLPHVTDKWNYLFTNLNKFIYRVPLKYTALFLGVRQETLSRIRKLIK